MKAIAGATGRSVQQIKAETTAKGDLGTVAEVSGFSLSLSLSLSFSLSPWLHRSHSTHPSNRPAAALSV